MPLDCIDPHNSDVDHVNLDGPTRTKANKATFQLDSGESGVRITSGITEGNCNTDGIPIEISCNTASLIRRLLGSIGSDFDLDLFMLDELTNYNCMYASGLELLLPFLSAGYFRCSEGTMKTFLKSLQKGYEDNEYHSALHAAQTAHLAVGLTRVLDIFASLDSYRSHPQADTITSANAVEIPKENNSDGIPEKYGEEALLTIACLGHDVGHPGLTESNLISTSHPLALVYNDHCVLENYHSYLTFRIMRQNGANILEGISKTQNASMRKRIVDLILNTDMKKHFDIINMARARRSSGELSVERSPEDRWMAASICVKIADIGHAALPWPLHSEWSKRLVQEYYKQGDAERSQGLFVTPMCDRTKESEIPNSQIRFADIILKPVMNVLEILDPQDRIAHLLIERVEGNKQKWTALRSNWRGLTSIGLSGKIDVTDLCEAPFGKR